jgi:hypothetical protein
MPTLKEVKAAEARMKAAQEALKGYAERSQSKPQDRDLHRRIADELANATNDYIQDHSEIGSPVEVVASDQACTRQSHD